MMGVIANGDVDMEQQLLGVFLKHAQNHRNRDLEIGTGT